MTAPALTPQPIDWSGPGIAKGWPEGSIVLVHCTDRPSSHCGTYRIAPHFRPDWVANDHGYGLHCRYLLLELAATP